MTSAFPRPGPPSRSTVGIGYEVARQAAQPVTTRPVVPLGGGTALVVGDGVEIARRWSRKQHAPR